MFPKKKILVGLGLFAVFGTAMAQWGGGGGHGGGRERWWNCSQNAIRIQSMNGYRYVMEDKQFTASFRAERDDVAEEGSNRLDDLATSSGFTLFGGVRRMSCTSRWGNGGGQP